MLSCVNNVDWPLIQTQTHRPVEKYREPREKLCIYRQLAFDKSTKNTAQ